MTRASVLAMALLLGACSDEPRGFDDLGAPGFIGVPTCVDIDHCVAGCSEDAGPDCATRCESGFDDLGVARYQELAACIDEACSSAVDGGAAPCADPGSLACMRCRTNAQYDTPAECAGAPAWCGACATQQAACFGA